jgi:integrase/recombinase XerD
MRYAAGHIFNATGRRYMMALVSKFKRGKFWYLRYNKHIGLPKKSLGTADAKVAEAIRVNEERKFVLGAYGVKDKVVAPVRYSQFVKHYLKHKKSVGIADGTMENYETTLNRFGTLLKRDEMVDRIAVSDLEKYMLWLREEGYAPKTVRNEIMALVTAFRWALRRHFVSADPSRELELPPPVHHDPRPLSFKQYLAFKATIDDEEYKDIVDFYLLTGIRRSDGPTIRISVNFDLDARTMILPQSKQRNSKPMHISDELLPVINRLVLRAKGSDRLISMHKSDLSKQFRKAADKAGLPKHLSFHSLRHSFATWLAEAGVGMKTIQQLIGHKDAASTQIYMGAFDEGLRRGIEKLKLPKNENAN